LAPRSAGHRPLSIARRFAGFMVDEGRIDAILATDETLTTDLRTGKIPD
jgi:hypothetical protein